MPRTLFPVQSIFVLDDLTPCPEKNDVEETYNFIRSISKGLVSSKTSLYFAGVTNHPTALLHVHHIESLENPALSPYRTLRHTIEHEKDGIFVAEGEKVVARLVESDLQIVSVLITKEWLEIYRSRLESRHEEIKVFVSDKTVLSTVVGFHLHQGIMAVAKIPIGLSLDSIVRESEKPFLFVAVEGMTNSENLGVLVRNCVAFGVQALIVGETSSNPYLRRAVRNSMGTIFKLPVIRSVNLSETVLDLEKRLSVAVVAAHPRAEQVSIGFDYFKKDCCIVFGSEGYGISQKVLAACSHSVTIPMVSGVDSLNVSSASAVLLYEVMRQRRKR